MGLIIPRCLDQAREPKAAKLAGSLTADTRCTPEPSQVTATSWSADHLSLAPGCSVVRGRRGEESGNPTPTEALQCLLVRRKILLASGAVYTKSMLAWEEEAGQELC